MRTPKNGGKSDSGELTSRDPSVEDLAQLCKELNDHEVQYVVIGGFAIKGAGYDRMTRDIDLLIDTSIENERRAYLALEYLPDQAVLELDEGDVAKFQVCRVADEITVDLMKAACGIEFQEAAKHIIYREIGGVKIPFASPSLLWRMKVKTHREKDAGDLVFLREYFAAIGQAPPEV